MRIRRMNKADTEKVRKIASAAWRNTYSNFIPREIQVKVLQNAYSDKEMKQRFRSSLNLVAEHNDEVLGYAFFSGDVLAKEVYLESLYINPEHQGKGIGKQLMYAGLAKFKEPTALSLVVYKGNDNIVFYEKQGFKVISEGEGDFFGHPVVFIKMKKSLVENFIK